MTLLSAENLCKRHKDQIILDQVSFTVGDRDRIALVGRNGIGKTTLLEILARKQSPDSGAVNCAKRTIIDYIEQEKTEYLEQTLFDFVADARAELIEMRHQIEALQHHLETNPSAARELEKLGNLQQEYERLDGFAFDSECGTILSGLGFERERFGERLRNFSGGERNRAGLARLLAGQGQLLLLDEPTNHLDIESTAWLEDYLAGLNKAIMIVSHDRTFLSATTNEVWEITFGRIEKYAGGVDKYLVERLTRRDLAEHRYRHQQEEIKRIEEFIRRNMAGQKTKQAQSRLKYLDRIKRLPPPRADGLGPAIKVQSSGRSYAHVLSMSDVSVAYGSEPVVEAVNFDLYRGDKIGLIGRNGSGKSSLLKTLIGELSPTSGNIQLGNNVSVAYFDQGLSDLNENASVLDNIWQVDPSAEPGPLRSFLARFGFTGEDVFKIVRALSGGEKTKVCLARLLYHPANLVILDEPTNHLDMQAREALESALIEYDGSCLIVSHDRYFLDRVVTKIAHIEDTRLTIHNGNYSDFAAAQQALRPESRKKTKTGKSDFFEFKEKSKRRARHKKSIESTKEKITTTEAELAQLENDLAQTDRTDDWEHLQGMAENKKQLEENILELYAKLEELEATDLD
jgi:ATP-binding cassette subfamily F protein 3